jgi:hypothetical protein
MPDRHFSPRAPRRATFAVLRAVLPVAILAATLPPLAARFAATDAVAVAAALSAVTPVALIAALGATALSFAAVGRYETGIHRWLGTGADRVMRRGSARLRSPSRRRWASGSSRAPSRAGAGCRASRSSVQGAPRSPSP